MRCLKTDATPVDDRHRDELSRKFDGGSITLVAEPHVVEDLKIEAVTLSA